MLCLTGRLLPSHLTLNGWMLWALHDCIMHASLSLSVWVLILAVPYRNTAAKCILFAWFGYEFIQFIQSVFLLFAIKLTSYPRTIETIVAAILASWYFFRSYDLTSDPIDDDHLFILRLRPDGLQDTIIAMCSFLPFGGMAIAYKGQIWRYRQGKLVKSKFTDNSRYFAIRGRIPHDSTIWQLDELVGTKWSLRKNCFTTLGSIARGEN